MKQYEYARMKMPVECAKGEIPDLEKIELAWLNRLGKLGWQLSMMSLNTIIDNSGQLFVREVESAMMIKPMSVSISRNLIPEGERENN